MPQCCRSLPSAVAKVRVVPTYRAFVSNTRMHLGLLRMAAQADPINPLRSGSQTMQQCPPKPKRPASLFLHIAT